MPSETNPLRQYFRQPAIFLRLPSQGKHWPPGSLTLPANGEMPIYPMTAVDEITTRTPDALFNGSAVVRIIESCVPGIHNAWSMPSMDLDALLVSVRIATYGHTMDISTKCPNCGHEADYALDLRHVLEGLQVPDFDTPLDVKGLQVYFAPMTYQQMNENSQLQFEDQKLMQVMQDSDMNEEEKIKRLSDSFLRITDLSVRSLAQSIGAIRTPQAVVTEIEHIKEFLENCERDIFTQIRDRAIELRKTGELKPLKIKCTECGTEHEQVFTLDISNFFASNS